MHHPFICLYMYIHIDMYTYMFVCIHVCMYMCMLAIEGLALTTNGREWPTHAASDPRHPQSLKPWSLRSRGCQRLLSKSRPPPRPRRGCRRCVRCFRLCRTIRVQHFLRFRFKSWASGSSLMASGSQDAGPLAPEGLRVPPLQPQGITAIWLTHVLFGWQGWAFPDNWHAALDCSSVTYHPY